MALEDFSPIQVKILVRYAEYSRAILLCDFIKDSAGNDATHWEVGIRGSFFEKEEVNKALNLFSNRDEDISFSGNGDKLTRQRFSGAGPLIIVANVSGKSITEEEAKTADDIFLRKENIIQNAFSQLRK